MATRTMLGNSVHLPVPEYSPQRGPLVDAFGNVVHHNYADTSVLGATRMANRKVGRQVRLEQEARERKQLFDLKVQQLWMCANSSPMLTTASMCVCMGVCMCMRDTPEFSSSKCRKNGANWNFASSALPAESAAELRRKYVIVASCYHPSPHLHDVHITRVSYKFNGLVGDT